MSTKKTALLSVFDKTGIVDFAQTLISQGWDIMASGGTAQCLLGAGVMNINVSTVVGEPILGHRVVTLSREIHAGLLATESEADVAELERLKIRRIDLVYVNLYPLEKAIAENAPLSKVIEMTDIGGPTLLRAAAKGGRIVVSSPDDIAQALALINQSAPLDGPKRSALLLRLAAKAEIRVSEYCKASGRYLSAAADAADQILP